jgi:hypothetical protein
LPKRDLPLRFHWSFGRFHVFGLPFLSRGYSFTTAMDFPVPNWLCDNEAIFIATKVRQATSKTHPWNTELLRITQRSQDVRLVLKVPSIEKKQWGGVRVSRSDRFLALESLVLTFPTRPLLCSPTSIPIESDKTVEVTSGIISIANKICEEVIPIYSRN